MADAHIQKRVKITRYSHTHTHRDTHTLRHIHIHILVYIHVHTHTVRRLGPKRSPPPPSSHPKAPHHSRRDLAQVRQARKAQPCAETERAKATTLTPQAPRPGNPERLQHDSCPRAAPLKCVRLPCVGHSTSGNSSKEFQVRVASQTQASRQRGSARHGKGAQAAWPRPKPCVIAPSYIDSTKREPKF